MWTLHEGDCLEIMPQLPDKSIDMILCDLPYGTTQNRWDSIIPLDKLWAQYNRIIKDNGAIVLTCSQPFTTILNNSNIKLYRYEWIWIKNNSTGFVNANRMPLKKHENISVFYKSPCTYNPQGLKPYGKINKRGSMGGNWNTGTKNEYTQEHTNFPVQIIEFKHDKEKYHPTQKPVALFEYLIKTYTNPGETILDNCAGSGTTGVAAENCGRNSILIEKEQKYCEIIRQRMTALEGGLFNEGV